MTSGICERCHDRDPALFAIRSRLADNALVLGHRLSEWVGHAPVLEEDLALGNLGLDLIGQARAFYAYAGEIEGKGRDEDAFAYLRDARRIPQRAAGRAAERRFRRDHDAAIILFGLRASVL